MHVVHSSVRSKNYVVTGFFFEVSEEDNEDLEPLIQVIDGVTLESK